MTEQLLKVLVLGLESLCSDKMNMFDLLVTLLTCIAFLVDYPLLHALPSLRLL